MNLSNNNNSNQVKTNGILDNCRSITVYPNGNGNINNINNNNNSNNNINNKFTNGGSPFCNSNNKINVNGNRLPIVSDDKPSSTGSSESDTLPGQTRLMKISSNSLVDYDDDSSDDDSDSSNPVQNGFTKIMNPNNQLNGITSKKAEKRLRKLKKKNKRKDKRKRKRYSDELEWVERTKETVEKERRIKHQI